MIKTNKKNCINISTDSYSGKEQSPKGFGYSADGFELNYEKIGQDSRIWIVQIKNVYENDTSIDIDELKNYQRKIMFDYDDNSEDDSNNDN